MRKNQTQSKVDALLADYSLLDRDIRALTWLLVGMIFMYAMFISWSIFKSESETAWRAAQILGVLASALIVSKTASRHICHMEIVRQNESDVSVVRRTHQAMAVLADLQQRVKYVKNFFQSSDKSLIALSRNVKTIEEHYHFLYNRELYELLSPEAIKTIGTMSGSIFALCTCAEALVHDYGLTARLSSQGAMSSNENLEKSIDSLLSEIELLDKEIRRVRSFIGR